MSTTHEVTNQVPPLVDYDAAEDPSLLEGLRREGAGWAEAELHELGRLAGSAQAQEWGRVVNENEPVLHTHDRYGNRIDEVEFHPYWHSLMNVAVEHGLHGAPWADSTPGAHVARAAKLFVWGQVDAGHTCPISMTYAVIPTLRANPELAAQYEPLLTNRTYDFGLRVPASKQGLIAGMSMTEKQGGSDVRANTTLATPAGDGTYRLVGHKWFTSAPMSDIFATLAQAPGGLTCFLLPRVLPDGTRNRMHIQRLKDKLGNRSNASAELEYDEAIGWRLGEEGEGVKVILRMVNNTRLDCLLGSAAGMRFGAVQAVHHARYRSAFGSVLFEKPLMRNVLADLVVESEAATAVAMRLAGATDRGEETIRRIGLAVSKYWVCKRAPVHAAEALECFGGNGYIEDFGMARLYREAPLQSIWEGSGNVAALDALRAMARQPETVEAFFTEVEQASGADTRLDDAIEGLRKELSNLEDIEFRARRVVESMALVLQGSLLVRHGTPAVADAFCASRFAGDWGVALGTLPSGVDTKAITERALV
ncbi:acyl-CoA dehydrogenase family protein [Kibdelosporangium philippinense]|uniref:Acyl-CoA dehydrogenase family protein n=1 Tax=Kibdelosporangium philippinense TaxID=211113 RepID=A0ABS8ZBF4_9PSEU|nr:acyl-CoA dehydrogenase family protein [Kibdelosporangium philippinense]MCE7004494.1 acyl-CoA dehydrogenase family protein [Kibdelosporangium philippinense]